MERTRPIGASKVWVNGLRNKLHPRGCVLRNQDNLRGSAIAGNRIQIIWHRTRMTASAAAFKHFYQSHSPVQPAVATMMLLPRSILLG
jgi:hypothetical protein